MAQSILSQNSSGFNIRLLPLTVKSVGAGSIMLNSITIDNITQISQRYVFKLRNQYVEYSGLDVIYGSANNQAFNEGIPNSLNAEDFSLQNTILLDDPINDFLKFNVSFEPISNNTEFGIFNSVLRIKYFNLQTSGADEFVLNIQAQCQINSIVDTVDGLPIISDNYIMSIHSNIIDGNIEIG